MHRLDVRAKGQNDFVTEIDMQAEREIIEIVRKHYPDHAFLAEESGRSGTDDEFVWIIDPLDGTTNFMHGFPQFAVSIGVSKMSPPFSAERYSIIPRCKHAKLSGPMKAKVSLGPSTRVSHALRFSCRLKPEIRFKGP